MKPSAFKTMKRSKTASNLVGLAKKSKPQDARRITRQGFKQPQKSSLSKRFAFRPVSPQSQPQLMQQSSQGLPVFPPPQSADDVAQQMQNMSFNHPPSPTSSEEELSEFMNENPKT